MSSTVDFDSQAPLSPALAGTLMTPEEFDSFDEADEGYVYELIHGVLVVTPPPLEAERGPNELLGNLLFVYRRTDPRGAALDATLPEQRVRTQGSRRRADRVIWAGLGRMPDPRRDVPAIVVEFVSQGKRNRQRDYLDKRDEYLAAGVVEYWVLNRFRRHLTVFRAGAPPLVIPSGEIYRTPLLPGFDLPLAELFAAADDWSH